MRMPRSLVLASALLAGMSVSTFGAGPSFRPDTTFQGSTLAGWTPLGDAAWKASNGEISATPTQPAGGWLVLDKSLQDVGVFTSFKCAAACKVGVLLRAEKRPDGGLKGVLASFSEGDIAAYAVTIDAQGKETSRERLRPGGGQVRIAPPPDPSAAPPAARGAGPGAVAGRGGPGRGGPAVTLPIAPPNTAIRPGDWNDVEILLDANLLRFWVNNGTNGAVADDDAGRYGPIALYAGGTGAVSFRNIAYKDINVMVRSPEKVSSRFRKQQLSDFYYSWGASAADFNHDGVTDIVSGPHIYFGPDYTRRREIYLAVTTNPSTNYTGDDWMQFSSDFTGDGWADVINCSFSGAASGCVLYVNPKGEARRWDKYQVTTGQQTEIAVLKDVDGDGKPDLVYGGGGAMHYAHPDAANPTGKWIVRTVSEVGYATAHGVGAGDVNGDGKVDILNAYGWWEQPASADAAGPWRYHPQAFGRSVGARASAGGSVMAVYDVNGDKLNDVVTSLSAHGYGLAWYEQKRDASGAISFVQHMIMDDPAAQNAGGVSFSEPHGSAVADVDGDGVPDFIVGKRYWAHLDDHTDPDAYGDPVLYAFRTVRNAKAPGGAEFVPELIHNHSGAGSDVFAGDINKDGRVDVVTATKFGTFVFWGTK